MDSNPRRIHLENDSINGNDYIGTVISMDPRQLHNEICAAAENLRRKYGITDVSINPWFYLIPPKPRRDKNQIHGVHDLWKLYEASGDDTDSDEEDRRNVVTVPENSSSQNGSGTNNAAASDNAGTFKSNGSSSSAETEGSKEESTKDLEVAANVVDPSSASQKKNKKPKKNKSLPSAKLLEKSLPAVNYAKEREGKLHSFYGTKACHIKAKEDCLKVSKVNYTNTCNSLYWPCEPLNHRYAFGKLRVQC